MMAQKKRTVAKILTIGLIAAAVTALIAAWKASNPIDDPWKLPTPQPTTHDPVEQAKPATVEQVKDLASE